MRHCLRNARLVAVTLVAFGAIVSVNANAETIKLVTGNGYKPFADNKLPAGGLVTDIVRQAYTAAGHSVKIDFMPWRRGERLMAKGKRVATFPYVKTPERRKKYIYSDPVFVAEQRPVVYQDEAGSISSYEDMKGKSICIPVGWKMHNRTIRKMVDSGDLKEFKPVNIENCFRMMKADHVKFTLLERPTALHKRQNSSGPASNIHMESLTTSTSTLHLIFSRDVDTSEDERKRFNNALEKLKKSGKYQEIVQKHLGSMRSGS
mgnify:CR=1 FL=1